jgi:hypothetical protein
VDVVRAARELRDEMRRVAAPLVVLLEAEADRNEELLRLEAVEESADLRLVADLGRVAAEREG